jgi:hypothetical protein
VEEHELSSKIIDETAEIVEKSGVSGRHTFYQLKHFVLGKEITTQAKMWKCIRELEARLGSIKSISSGLAEAEDDQIIIELRLKSLEKKKTKSTLHRQYLEIKRRKLERRRDSLLDSISEMKKRFRETEEEMSFFLGAYRQMESMESLKPHDDPESNARYWDQNFAQEIQLRMLLQRPLDLELIKCVLALDDKSSIKRDVVGMLGQLQNRALSGSDFDDSDKKELKIEKNI